MLTKKFIFILTAVLVFNTAVLPDGIIDKAFGTEQPADIIIDNDDNECTFDSPWPVSASQPGFYGSNYAHDGDGAANPGKWAKFTPNIITAGVYDIYMRWVAFDNRPLAAPLEIKHEGGIDASKKVNQQDNNGIWVLVGRYTFSEGSEGYVMIKASETGYTIADAIKLVYYGAAEPTDPEEPPVPEKPEAVHQILDFENYYAGKKLTDSDTGFKTEGGQGACEVVKDPVDPNNLCAYFSKSNAGSDIIYSKALLTGYGKKVVTEWRMLVNSAAGRQIYTTGKSLETGSDVWTWAVALIANGNYGFGVPIENAAYDTAGDTWISVKVVADIENLTTAFYADGKLLSTRTLHNVAALDKLCFTASEVEKGIYIDDIRIYNQEDSGKIFIDTAKCGLSAGIYLPGTFITLESTVSGADIYYTIDGAFPTVSSKKYEEKIQLTDKDLYIRAIVKKDGIISSAKTFGPFSLKTVADISLFAAGFKIGDTGITTASAIKNGVTLSGWADICNVSSKLLNLNMVLCTYDANGFILSSKVQSISGLEKGITQKQVNLDITDDNVFHAIMYICSDSFAPLTSAVKIK